METRQDSERTHCDSCGSAVDPGARFCGYCGIELDPEPIVAAAPALRNLQARETVSSNLITTQRIVVMTFLSHGLYLLYWFYLTWRQYRDLTGEEAYPVWHALCLFVPVYNLFRIHAHMRTYRELLDYSGLATAINALMVVALMLLASIIDMAGAQLNGGITGREPVADWAPFAALALSVVSLAVYSSILTRVQADLNRYWAHMSESPPTAAGISAAEVIFAIMGVVAWVVTLALLAGVSDPSFDVGIQ